ncbi:MAG: phosphodiester glycosidase family protein [Trueperaceae bacterium]|nr:phosphodiester glycosidase family protein [Trueperaceae bacterium]
MRTLLAALVALGLLAGLASAQAPTWTLPGAWTPATDDGVRIEAPGATATFLPGLGWSGATGPPPERDDAGRVVVAAATVSALDLPRVTAVRRGLQGSTVRVVLDVAGLAAGTADLPADAAADVGPDAPWRATLPPLALPTTSRDGGDDVRVRLAHDDAAGTTRLAVDAPEARLTAFALPAPLRFVVDLAPPTVARGDGDGASVPGAPGVTYRTFDAVGAAGATTVHLVSIEPGAATFEVADAAGRGAPVATLADGAVAAINAGYFVPSDFRPIGLRRADGRLLAWPSRGRAAVGFADDEVVIARAEVHARILRGTDVLADVRTRGGHPLGWSAQAGLRVGSARQGALTLDARGVVTRNGVGPVTVPDGGSVLTYQPELRALALVEPGERLEIDARLLPAALDGVAWAVEAGPLLIEGGRPAFEPEREAFARGVRILDAPTQQAGLGVTPDGTVLLLVAETMVAEDLVSVFGTLGAEAALRLDSGGSATLWTGGRTVNRLVGRAVESAIVAYPSATADTGR